MRLNINLATQPYQDVRRFLFRWGFGVAALAIITAAMLWMAIGATISWRKSAAQANHFRAEIARCDREEAQAKAMLNLPANSATNAKSTFINTLIARKAFSWTEVLMDLERILPSGIQVTAIQPAINENGQMEIRLTAAGPSRDRAIDLVSRMESSPHFRNAMIRSDAVAQGQDQNNPQVTYRFDISAIYVPSYERPATAQAGSLVAQQGGQ